MKSHNKKINGKFHNSLIGILAFVALFVVVYLVLVFLSCADFKAETTVNSIENLPVIIIDAGHGGIDGGAVGSNGSLEKDINLNISRYLSDMFTLSNVECVLTRSDDSMLEAKNGGSSGKKRSDLMARVEIAKEYDNAIFVSIHQNKFTSSRYRGLQVFYSKNNAGSKILADIIKNNNRKLVDTSNKRETKPGGSEIYVLDSTEIPAVLIECGFLSNADEEAKLCTEEYQKKLAFMIYISIFEYLENQSVSSV